MTPIEDPLQHLPVSDIRDFRKGQVITSDVPSVHVVLCGLVKVSIPTARCFGQVLLDVCSVDGFFGLGSLVSDESETATALTNARVMSWPATEIVDIILKRPDLGLALLQVSVQRSMDLSNLVFGHVSSDIETRLSTSLLRLADKLGTPNEDGSIELFPFTHAVLAEYVGTSREIVSHCMNNIRRKGMIAYSRKSITIYPAAFAAPFKAAA